AGEAPYGAAIVDFQMPEMDGVELGKRIKADPAIQATPLVLLTSVDRLRDGKELRRIGFAAHLTKPVRSGVFLAAVAGAVDQSDGTVAGAARVPDPTDSIVRWEGARVLLAEDNDVNQRLATRLLEKRGFSVRIAPNGAEAVDAALRETFDLILMDVQMPIMDGLEATHRIRAYEADGGARVPIIAMTAHAMKGDRERCIEAGMDDYVPKPLDASTLF
ncbi:response regulator, partial [bacterium]|nr:response regulator [bacterium]